MEEGNFSATKKRHSVAPEQAVRAMRSRVLQTSLLIAGIIGIPLVAAIFYRASEFGWRNVNLVYLGAIVLAWLFVLLGDKIPLIVRTLITLSALFLVGTATLYSIGLNSMALVWLALFCMLSIIFMNTRIGLIALVLSLAGIAAVGLGIPYKYVSFAAPPASFYVSRSTWIITFLSFGLAGGIIISVLGRLQRFMLESIVRLSKQRGELQNANAALTKSEEHFRTLVETSPIAMVVGYESRKIGHLNKKFNDLFGYTTEDFQTQQDLIEAIFPDVTYRKEITDKWKADFAASIANKTEIDPMEAVVTCKDGRLRTIEFLAAVIGEVTVLACNDITERKAAEEAIVQSEKMMSVGQLAAGMAHEINNPLAGILQNAEVLRMRLTEHLPKNVQAAEECGITMDHIVRFGHKRAIPQSLERLADAGARAARIVENMLGFARRSQSVKAPRDLRALLDATIELCTTDYDFKRQYDFLNIEIVREYADDIPLVPCEPTEIQQVFLNVLKNGAEAMNLLGSTDPSSVVGKEKQPHFLLRINRHGNMVRVEIEDNGPGMDPETRKRIFEPFYTSKEVGVGTGLGLSVSYFIIANNHNGNLAVESTPGRGTKFIIDLPVK